MRLTFYTISTKDNKQRAFIDEIKVEKGTTNSISQAKIERLHDNKLYTIDGREVTGYGHLHGIFIRNGKKVKK